MKAPRTIEELIEKLAPPTRGNNGIEHYSLPMLGKRLGLDDESLVPLLESGAIRPSGNPLKGQRKDKVYPFLSTDLNVARRSLIAAALHVLADELRPGDDSESEQKFVQAAEMLIRGERESIRSRGPKPNGPTVPRENVLHGLNAVCPLEMALAIGIENSAIHEFSANELLALPAIRFAGGRLVGIQFDGQPLTGKLPKDRYIKQIRDEDLNRRDANILRSGALGAVAGAALPATRLAPLVKGALGAAAGVGGTLAVRAATQRSEDIYGDRSRGAKTAEGTIPLIAGGALLGAGALRLRKILQSLGKRVGGVGSTRLSQREKALYLNQASLFSDDEKVLLFEIGQEFGIDCRHLGSRVFEGRSFRFAAASILERLAEVIQNGGFKVARNLVLPGTTANTIAKTGLKGAAAGAVGGASQAVLDNDPNTGVLGGIARGAGAGAALGGALGLVRGATPLVGEFKPGMDSAVEKLRRAASKRGVMLGSKSRGLRFEATATLDTFDALLKRHIGPTSEAAVAGPVEHTVPSLARVLGIDPDAVESLIENGAIDVKQFDPHKGVGTFDGDEVAEMKALLMLQLLHHLIGECDGREENEPHICSKVENIIRQRQSQASSTKSFAVIRRRHGVFTFAVQRSVPAGFTVVEFGILDGIIEAGGLLGRLGKAAAPYVGKGWGMVEKAGDFLARSPATAAVGVGGLSAAGTAIGNQNLPPDEQKSVLGSFIKNAALAGIGGIATEGAIGAGGAVLRGAKIGPAISAGVDRVAEQIANPTGIEKFVRSVHVRRGIQVGVGASLGAAAAKQIGGREVGADDNAGEDDLNRRRYGFR